MEQHERTAFSSPIAGKVVTAGFDGGRLTSDAGVLVLADIERRLGIAERLARCIADPRSPERVHRNAHEQSIPLSALCCGFPLATVCLLRPGADASGCMREARAAGVSRTKPYGGMSASTVSSWA